MKKIFKIMFSFIILVFFVAMTSSVPVASSNNFSEENLSALKQQSEFDNTDDFVHIFCRSTLFANCHSARDYTWTWSAHGEWNCSASGYKSGINPN